MKTVVSGEQRAEQIVNRVRLRRLISALLMQSYRLAPGRGGKLSVLGVYFDLAGNWVARVAMSGRDAFSQAEIVSAVEDRVYRETGVSVRFVLVEPVRTKASKKSSRERNGR